MSEIKPCPEELLERDLHKLADNLIAGKRVCTPDGFAHKPLVPAALLSAPERAIDAIIDIAASRDRASDACASVQRERDALRDAMQEICCQSNEDWAEARTNPNATLNRIHEIAVDAFYGKSE